MISAKCEKKNVYVVNTGCWWGTKQEAKTLKEAKKIVRADLRMELRCAIMPCIQQFDKRKREYITAEWKLSDIELAKKIHKLYEKYKEHI